MGFCILCFKPPKSNATNINESLEGSQNLVIRDLIRVYFSFGEVRVKKKFKKKILKFLNFQRILTETKSETLCYRCFVHVTEFHAFHESVAINYGFYEHLQSHEKKEPESSIVYETMQEDKQHPATSGMFDDQLIKMEEPDDESPPIEMNWIDEYAQESVMTPMPEPTPSTSKQHSRRGRPRKIKTEEGPSHEESADDQRIRDTASTTCEYCFEDLINFREAKIHYKEMHGVEGYFTCCGKKFKQKCRLVDHVNLHYELLHNCTICGKSFSSKSYLMKHMACHEVEKEYVRLSTFS